MQSCPRGYQRGRGTSTNVIYKALSGDTSLFTAFSAVWDGGQHKEGGNDEEKFVTAHIGKIQRLYIIFTLESLLAETGVYSDVIWDAIGFVSRPKKA